MAISIISRVIFLFQFHYGLFRHFFVDVAVAVEGAGVLDMAGDLGDKVGVFDLFVEIADQDATGYVG